MDNQIKKFVNFSLQLRSLAGLRCDKGQKCFCCFSFDKDGDKYVPEQIDILIRNYLGINKNEIMPKWRSNYLNLIIEKAQTIFPHMEDKELEELVLSLIY